MPVGVVERVQRGLEDECNAVLGQGVGQAVADVVAQVHAAVGVDEEQLQGAAPVPKCPAAGMLRMSPPIESTVPGDWPLATDAITARGAGAV